jgi:phosphatidylserine/phosphatidylglycerophosphate/cardiolipin synthase-like enzyme
MPTREVAIPSLLPYAPLNRLAKATARRFQTLADEGTADHYSACQVFPEPEPGRVRIGRDVLSEADLDSLGKLAAEVNLPARLSRQRIVTIMDEIRDQQSITKNDLKVLEKFVRAMRDWHKQLHASYRQDGYHNDKVSADLLACHHFLHQWDGAKERYRITQRTEELSRIGAGSSAVNPTTQAFYTYAQTSQRDMKRTLHVMEALADGNRRVTLDGNRTTVLTRDEIWQTKMKLLDEAIENGKKGHPVEIDVQYYELTSQRMLRKLVAAARAGNSLRVNLDPGRLSESRDGDLGVSELARKLQTAYRMLDAADEGLDIGFTLFPTERVIGPENLMHQKFFRVGERVLLGGMNANARSGENVDAAVLIEGPAARRLVGVFSRDTQLSLGAKLNDVYHPEHTAMLATAGMHIGPTALIALLLNAAGKKYRDVDSPRLPHTPQTLKKLAKAAGTRLDLVIDMQSKDDAALAEFLRKGDMPSNVVQLKRDGGRLVARQVREVAERIAKKGNQERAARVTSPLAAPQGKQTVSVGDGPTERTALMLHAISHAEKFVYVPAYVLTRVVAKALVARAEELRKQGRTLDVRVILDPSIYPDGGTPNEGGYLALEDGGVKVRWAQLVRTELSHNRKVHAKAIITEKTALLGSTNFSSKGLKSNWELSGLIDFDESDADSVKQRQRLVDDFLQTWQRESIEIDTNKVAENRLADVTGPDRGARLEEARHGVVLESIHMLVNYERDSVEVVNKLLNQHPELDADIQRRIEEGMTPGYAKLTVIEDKLGHETLQHALQATPSARALRELAAGHYIPDAPSPTLS